nr:tetratricopeptide repeat protein 9C [Labrus bergylta]
MEAAGEETMDVQGAAAEEPIFPGHGQTSAKPVWASLEEAAQKKTELLFFYPHIRMCISLSACLLQKQSVDYARVREYSLRVLKWRPGDVKALYRAGVATLEMGDAQAAKQYLTQACREQPNDANVRKHLQRAEEKLNKELQKEKAMYRGMFSSSLKSSSVEEMNQTHRTGEGV